MVNVMEQALSEVPMLFPDAAIAILRGAVWSPDAERTYELMSGGFVWSDECLLGDVARICVRADNWAFRFVIGYRASLIRGKPRTELLEPWNQLRVACPNWPGFREERIDHSLRGALDADNAETLQQVDRLSEVCERVERIHAIRKARQPRAW